MFHGKISEDSQATRVPVRKPEVTKFLLTEGSFIAQMTTSVGIEARSGIWVLFQAIHFEIREKIVILGKRLR
jgi:hypothetical protein